MIWIEDETNVTPQGMIEPPLPLRMPSDWIWRCMLESHTKNEPD